MITHLYIYPSEPSSCRWKTWQRNSSDLSVSSTNPQIPHHHKTIAIVLGSLQCISTFYRLIRQGSPLYNIFEPLFPPKLSSLSENWGISSSQSQRLTRDHLTIFPPTPPCPNITLGYLKHFEHNYPDGRYTSWKQLG
jgi:hypothetical protein